MVSPFTLPSFISHLGGEGGHCPAKLPVALTSPPWFFKRILVLASVSFLCRRVQCFVCPAANPLTRCPQMCPQMPQVLCGIRIPRQQSDEKIGGWGASKSMCESQAPGMMLGIGMGHGTERNKGVTEANGMEKA